eukprot:CAMPEP_0173451640 /NCGR_PEP_ID=MMETSP1357-20121228/47154_1 /TAXON_ID=77926 /ORGANISM="Hemiselmis rufescens, Strain PCC563" /LENGTH=249 /DNA_ID=CAMNT_0014418421 /DNA_START=12 /DNA_END=761 /DNA_ORIENTATION=-
MGDDGEGEAKLEGSDVVFQTKHMNQHLICSLCMGYLRDANTVTECLHTFCKVCIYKHLAEYGFCPTCEVSLGPTPKDRIRSDRAMQNIVDKVFPHFAREEAAAEKAFKGGSESAKGNSDATKESEAKRRKVMQTVKDKRKEKEKEAASVGNKICLTLFPALDEKGEDQVPRLLQPYLRSSVDATVRQHKLYLSKKLAEDHDIKVTISQVDFVVKGTVLKNDMTFGEVWKQLWGVDDNSHLGVEYSIKKE